MEFAAPIARWRNRITLLAALLVVWTGNAACANEPMSILIVHSYEEFIPWNQSFTEGLTQWQTTHTQPVQIYREYMNAPELTSSHDADFWHDYLKRKYAGISLDAIMGESAEAATLVHRIGDSINPGAITIYHTAESIALKARQVHLTPEIGELVRRTVDFAHKRHPEARHVAVVDGRSPLGEIAASHYLELLARLPDLTVHKLSDFTLEELAHQVSQLPSDTIIFYTLAFNDRSGKRFVPKAVLNRILESTRAPVYVNYSSLMGTGAIGGYLIDGATLASKALQATMDYHQNGFFSRSGYQASLALFDWKAMRERGISVSNLPEDAVLLNPPASFYELYETAIWISVAVLLAGLMLVTLRARHLSAINHTLNTLAMNDPLTGLYNRRALSPLISTALKTSGEGSPACLILADIDDFKQINDTHGHQIGDEVLIETAKRLRAELRKSDALSRWGGEEFLILLRDITLEESRQLADKLREAIRSEPVSTRQLTITSSFGVACLSGYSDFDTCFRDLDTALYSAKQSGKDCVKVAPPLFN